MNLQTWVMLLDYLGMGAKVHDPEQYTQEAQMNRSASKSKLSHPVKQASEASTIGKKKWRSVVDVD